MAVFDSVRRLLDAAPSSPLPLWQLMLDASPQDSGMTPEACCARWRERLAVMRQADAGYDPAQRSPSGLTGGDADRLRRHAEAGNTIAGPFVGDILAAALRMGECNACMHRIVAAPTAGACGVIPAVLLPYARRFGADDEALVRALYVSAGYGAVIARRASLSGAEAGCQAEIGSASAMAAAALVSLHGGSDVQMAHAAAIALKNLMGLVCDPVAGLVEVPCVKRNAIGAMNALTAAELALAGIESRIPADEVIDAMRAVGRSLSPALRETGRGGVAASPTAQTFREQFFGGEHRRSFSFQFLDFRKRIVKSRGSSRSLFDMASTRLLTHFRLRTRKKPTAHLMRSRALTMMTIGRMGTLVRRESTKATGMLITQTKALSKRKVMSVLPPQRSVK